MRPHFPFDPVVKMMMLDVETLSMTNVATPIIAINSTIFSLGDGDVESQMDLVTPVANAHVDFGTVNGGWHKGMRYVMPYLTPTCNGIPWKMH